MYNNLKLPVSHMMSPSWQKGDFESRLNMTIFILIIHQFSSQLRVPFLIDHIVRVTKTVQNKWDE